MKKALFLIALILAPAIVIKAQTITWTGSGANTNWNTVANWDLGVVPTASHDVIIPTGKTVVINVAALTKSVQVQGNANVSIAGGLSILNASSFAAASTITWSDGQLIGGGTLTNAGTITLTTTAIKYINALTTLNNTGTINMDDSGDLYISNGTLNNQAAGVIDLKTTEGNLSYNSAGLHTFNNAGLIKRTTSTGNVTIECNLNNTGTIAVQTGILTLATPAITLTGGTYNTTSGAILRFNSTITVNGTLSGTLNGELNWAGMVNIAPATTATFNFTGTAGINWSDGQLIGGGTLVNQSTVNLTTTAIKYIQDTSILNNLNVIKITDSGDLYISNGTVNNLAAGTIDLQTDSGNLSYNSAGLHILNNAGLIKKTIAVGVASISCVLQNTGTISVQSGTLSLDNIGITLTNGIYNVTAGTTFLWNDTVTVSGTLTGAVAGQINWNGAVNVPTTATLNFTGIGINWSNGTINGPGTLTNQGQIELTTSAIKYLQGTVTFVNNGTFKIVDTGDLYISNGTFNNQATGVIDLQNDAGYLSYNSGGLHLLNNVGLIKKTVATGITYIDCTLQNTGTISVQTGTLVLNAPSITLTGGTYNVLPGKVLRWASTVSVSGTLVGVVDGEINWSDTVRVTGTANFNFTGTGLINWSNGTLNGGGTLNNNIKMDLTSTAIKYLQDLTTFNNSKTLRLIDSGDLYISNGIFNNLVTGTIDLQAESGNLSYNSGGSHVLNNAGNIIRTTTTGTAIIECGLKNTGEIAVQSGILLLQNPDITFTNGTYNVTTGAILRLGATVTLTGNLTGILNGEMNWMDTINIPTAATLNFTGTNLINWSNGAIIGGGILTQKTNMNLSTTAIKYLQGTLTWNNEATINMIDTGDLYISNGTFNNQATGVIDLKVDNGDLSYNSGGLHILNNGGLIKKTGGVGMANIYPLTTNTGTVDAMSGTINLPGDFMFTNAASGIIKGTATIDLPPAANFVNEGTFAPGGSPGKLTVIGDYESTAASKLAVELNGLTPITQYDLLAITGNAQMNGAVQVVMGFNAAVGNSFTIATTTGTITQCNLTPTTTAIYNGFQYTCSVGCIDNNKVVLNITAKLDIQPPTALAQNLTIQLNAAGTATITPAQVNNGSTDNFTIPANLILSLSKTTFNCANIGANTVTLTVTDAAGNASTTTAIITVVDSIAPTVVCPANKIIATNVTYIIPAYSPNAATDNCGAPVVTQSPIAGTVVPIGVHPITFSATDASGNTATCTFTLTVNQQLGIDSNRLSEATLLLSPNPAQHAITLRNTSTVNLTEVTIIDFSGRTIKTISLENMTTDQLIGLDGIASGPYFMKITAENAHFIKKFIIE